MQINLYVSEILEVATLLKFDKNFQKILKQTAEN